MPQVPVSNGQQVSLGGLPNVGFDLPDAPILDARLNAPQLQTRGLSTPQVQARTLQPFTANPNSLLSAPRSDVGARQMTAVGRALTSVSDDIAKATMAFQVQVNATVVDDAMNDAREAVRNLTWGRQDASGQLVGGYKNLKGAAALRRPSNKALSDEVGEDFDKAVRDIAKSKITNDSQRRAFLAQIGDLRTQLGQGVAVYQSEQFNAYGASVYTNQVKNLTEGFARLDMGDQKGQGAELEKIDQAVATQAAHNGASAQELEVGQRAARSVAVKGMFDAAVSAKKYDTAQALLNTWGDKMDASTLAQMKTSLDGHVGIMVGEQIGETVWNGWASPSYTASDPDRAFNIVLGMETGRRQVGDNGKTMRSPKGAYGISQTMPETAKEVAKKLGRPELAELAMQPTKEGEAASLLLGRTYFDGLVVKYKGDTAKAMAGYNAGPGRVDEAVKQAAKEGGDWRTYLPRETRDYIDRGMRSYGEGRGVPAKPSKSQLYAQIDARSTDPDVRKAAYAWVDRRFTAADYDESQAQESAYTQALEVVRQTGGNINAVTPDIRAQMKGTDISALENYAQKLSNGEQINTDPAAYLLAMNPQTLKAMTPNQLEAFRTRLSPTDYNTVRKAYLDTQNPEPGKGPDSLDTSMLDELIDTRLKYMGVATPKGAVNAERTRAEARLGAIRQFSHQYVLDRQRQTGKKIETYQDMTAVVNELFTRSEQFDQKVFGIDTGKDGQVNVLTATYGDIPKDTRTRVESELQKHLKRKPSEAEVLQAYFRSQFYTGAGRGGR